MSELTPDILADALDCFWNAAIGEAHNRQSASAMDTASVIAEGFAAISRRLQEVQPHNEPTEAPLPLKASEIAAFKHAFYNNSGDETDDPFVKAFEAIGWAATSAEPPTGIARDVYGVRISFIADCLRNYADIVRRGQIDSAGHYFPSDIEEAADLIEAGEAELLEAGKVLAGSLAQTPERTAAMDHLRAVIEARA